MRYRYEFHPIYVVFARKERKKDRRRQKDRKKVRNVVRDMFSNMVLFFLSAHSGSLSLSLRKLGLKRLAEHD